MDKTLAEKSMPTGRCSCKNGGKRKRQRKKTLSVADDIKLIRATRKLREQSREINLGGHAKNCLQVEQVERIYIPSESERNKILKTFDYKYDFKYLNIIINLNINHLLEPLI